MKKTLFALLLSCSLPLLASPQAYFAADDYQQQDFYAQTLQLPAPAYTALVQLEQQLRQQQQQQTAQLFSIAYLEQSQQTPIIMLNALFHLQQSLLATRGNPAEQLEHSILALYFLERAIQLGETSPWLQHSRQQLARLLNQRLHYQQLHVSETSSAHRFFHDAFNRNPQNAALATRRLTENYLADPANVMTLTLMSAAQLWLGGEAAADDPATHQHFVLAAFYSSRAILLAEELEKAAIAAPAQVKPMRLASILGSWSYLPRRWLSHLHQQPTGSDALEAEQQQWFGINPGFHSVVMASSYFAEPANFMRGFAYLMQGMQECNQNMNLRSCNDNPRFSFNRLVFVQNVIDYAIKAGDFNTASMLLNARYWPDFHFDEWTSGHQQWALRETNMAELHHSWNTPQRSDDADYAINRQRRWGLDTMTCQTCHQQQQRQWTDEQQQAQPQPSVAILPYWPAISTGWFGSKPAVNCSNIPLWRSNMVYRQDDRVIYQHAVYQAKWWTQAEKPVRSVQYDVWNFVDFCQQGSVR